MADSAFDMNGVFETVGLLRSRAATAGHEGELLRSALSELVGNIDQKRQPNFGGAVNRAKAILAMISEAKV